jgi:hypothetical protein
MSACCIAFPLSELFSYSSPVYVNNERQNKLLFFSKTSSKKITCSCGTFTLQLMIHVDHYLSWPACAMADRRRQVVCGLPIGTPQAWRRRQTAASIPFVYSFAKTGLPELSIKY